MESLVYTDNRKIDPGQFIDLLKRSTLAERRPVSDAERIASMLRYCNLLCSAWHGDFLVGVARSVTDFSYCCYLSELAVDLSYQRRGIGIELIRLTQSRIHPQAKLVLLAAPKAVDYYPKIGMTRHESAWIAPGAPPITGRNRSEKSVEAK